MGNTITQATPTGVIGHAQVYFREIEFDATIWNHSYYSLFEKAMRCPCSGLSGNPLLSCENCFGTGYFYSDKYRTQALIIGINKDTQYQKWSPTLMGTVSVTVRDTDKEHFGYFDRITLEDQYGRHSESLFLRTAFDGNKFIFTTYAPIDIENICIFVSGNEPLLMLSKDEYEISSLNPYVIIIKKELGEEFNGAISVTYKHRVQYHILDLPHEIRASLRQNSNGALEVIQLPVNAIARRSHLIQSLIPNYDGSGIVNNK